MLLDKGKNLIGCNENLDYREWLRRKLEERTMERRFRSRFSSHKGLSTELGISPALLSLVLSGQRHLLVEHAAFGRLLEILQLTAAEKEYIVLLARQSQARSAQEKLQHSRQLAHFRTTLAHRELLQGQEGLLGDWRNLVIFEAIAQREEGVTEDLLVGEITVDLRPIKLSAVLGLLAKNNLIVETNGRFFARCKSLNIENVDEKTAGQYHRQMAELGTRALDNTPAHRRRYGALTVSIRREDLAECLAEVDKMRHRLREILCKYNLPDGNQLLQVNLQSFVLNDPHEEGQ